MISMLTRRRAGIRALALGILMAAIGASGCSTLRVESLPAPTANFSRSTTFRVVQRPMPVDTFRPASYMPNLILNNSIIDQMAENQIRAAFEDRGYTMTYDDPDFVVEYFVRATEEVEIDEIDRGYPYYWDDCCDVYEFTQGVVVIDVVDPDTRELLWRGTSSAQVSENPQKYAKQVARAIESIVDRFPSATARAYFEEQRRQEAAEELGEDI